MPMKDNKSTMMGKPMRKPMPNDKSMKSMQADMKKKMKKMPKDMQDKMKKDMQENEKAKNNFYNYLTHQSDNRMKLVQKIKQDQTKLTELPADDKNYKKKADKLKQEIATTRKKLVKMGGAVVTGINRIRKLKNGQLSLENFNRVYNGGRTSMRYGSIGFKKLKHFDKHK